MKMNQYQRQQMLLDNQETISYILTSDDKPKLLLIHGNNSGANHWLDVIDEFEKDYSVLVPDLRGFGDSSYVNEVRSLLELAQDLKELLNRLNWDHFSVIGWSLGGGVAMELAAIMPAQVDKLILNASVGVQGYPMYEFDMETGQPKLDKPLTEYEQIKDNPIYVLPIEMLKQSKNTEGLSQMLHGLTVNKPISDEYMDIVVETMMKQKNLVDADYALLTFNITNEDTPAAKGSNHIQQIKAPVLILQGNQDMVTLPIMSQLTAKQFGDQAKLVTFENAGHAVHVDQWEDWKKEVVSFLEK